MIGFCAALLKRTEKQLQTDHEMMGIGTLLEYCCVRTIQTLGPKFVFEHSRLAFSMLSAVSRQALEAAAAASAKQQSSAELLLLPVEDSISRDVWQTLIPSWFPALADVSSAQTVFDALLDAQKRLETRKSDDKSKDSKSSKKSSKDKSKKEAEEDDEEEDEIVSEPLAPAHLPLQFTTFDHFVTALAEKLTVRSSLDSETLDKVLSCLA